MPELSVECTNPAARLVDLVERAMAMSPNQPTRHAWASVFECDPQDTASLLRHMADLWFLISESKRMVREVRGEQSGLYLDAFPVLEDIIRIENFGTEWHQWIVQLKKPHVLLGVRFCSELLNDKMPERVIPKDQRDTILKSLDACRAAISEDPMLDHRLSALLLDQVESMRLCVVRYDVLGAKGLRNALDSTIGSMITHRGLLTDDAKTSTSFARLNETLDQIATALESVERITASGFRIAGAFTAGFLVGTSS